MNFEYSEEQEMLRDGLSRLLAQKYPFEERQRIIRGEAVSSLRQAFLDMGLFALLLPERAGGLGGSAKDLVALAEILGRHLVVEPFLSPVIFAGSLLGRLERSDLAEKLLPDIAEGRVAVAVAHEEGVFATCPDQLATRLRSDGTALVLTGRKRLVLDGGAADLLLVTANDVDGCLVLACIDRTHPNVACRVYRTIDGRAAADIGFVDVPVEPHRVVRSAGTALQGAIGDAILALSAEAVGAMGSLLDASAHYAHTRMQFGRPIAEFQVISHRLADMKIACIKAHSTLLHTATLAEQGAASPRDLSLLKAQVGRLGRQVAEPAVQIHGGIGMTDELPVGHWLKRILAVDMMFGATDAHLREVGKRRPSA